MGAGGLARPDENSSPKVPNVRAGSSAEIVDAFASANETREDAFGEAPPSPPPSPGTLPFAGGTANTIPLNWFRGYFVDNFPHNVFGPDENTPGGAIAFLSAAALP